MSGHHEGDPTGSPGNPTRLGVCRVVLGQAEASELLAGLTLTGTSVEQPSDGRPGDVVVARPRTTDGSGVRQEQSIALATVSEGESSLALFSARGEVDTVSPHTISDGLHRQAARLLEELGNTLAQHEIEKKELAEKITTTLDERHKKIVEKEKQLADQTLREKVAEFEEEIEAVKRAHQQILDELHAQLKLSEEKREQDFAKQAGDHQKAVEKHDKDVCYLKKVIEDMKKENQKLACQLSHANAELADVKRELAGLREAVGNVQVSLNEKFASFALQVNPTAAVIAQPSDAQAVCVLRADQVLTCADFARGMEHNVTKRICQGWPDMTKPFQGRFPSLFELKEHLEKCQRRLQTIAQSTKPPKTQHWPDPANPQAEKTEMSVCPGEYLAVGILTGILGTFKGLDQAISLLKGVDYVRLHYDTTSVEGRERNLDQLKQHPNVCHALSLCWSFMDKHQ